MSTVRRLPSPIVEVRPEEIRTVLLMFAYSFAGMTAYNIIQPVTRSRFIADLGADNIPYALFTAGLLIGFIMQAYGWVVARLPQRWALPIVQLGLTGLLLVFWTLFLGGASWVSAGFYLFGQILGTLLLSQFWTLANEGLRPRDRPVGCSVSSVAGQVSGVWPALGSPLSWPNRSAPKGSCC